MSVKKIEIRPKGDGTYSDILYPKTSVDMVDGAVSDSEFTTHEADDANPHGVTALQVGAHPKIIGNGGTWEWKIDTNGSMYIEQVQ